METETNEINVIPNVSIVLPIYNASKYLDRCFASLQSQTLTNIEIICVDDGSTDNSLEICQRYAEKDSRFKVIHQNNQGQGVARNNGIEIATGEYIAFVDPDDWVREDMYEKLYKKAKEYNCEVAQCNYKIISSSGSWIANVEPHKRNKKQIYTWDKLLKHGYQDFCLYCWNKIYKRDLIKEINAKFEPFKISEEHNFVISTIINSKKIGFVSAFLYYYVVRDNSSDHAYRINRLNASSIVNSVKNTLIKAEIFEKTKVKFYKYAEFVYYYAYLNISKNAIPQLLEMAKQDLPSENYERFYNKANNIRFFTKNNFLENIFSIKTKKNAYVKEKIVTILGHKFKLIANKKQRKTKMKKLSVITICYNDPNLELTCKSIAKQTWKDFEWIVIDGGSKPEILEILNKYKGKITKLISEPDNGINDAVNKGLALATGEYIQLLNAGDTYFNSKVLEKIFDNNKKHKDIIYGHTNNINHEKWMPDFYFNPKKIKKDYFIYQNLQTPSMFVKNELYQKYGNFSDDYKIVSDRDRWIVFMKNGATFEYSNVIVSSFDGSGLSSREENFIMHNHEIEQLIHKHYTDEQIKKALKRSKLSIIRKIFSLEKHRHFYRLNILFMKIKIQTILQKIKYLKDRNQALRNELSYLKKETDIIN